MKIYRSQFKKAVFISFLIFSIFGFTESKAQQIAVSKPFCLFDLLSILINIKTSYNRSPSADELNELILASGLNANLYTTAENKNGIDTLLGRLPKKKNDDKPLNFIVSNRGIALVGESTDFQNALSDLVNDLIYDDNYAVDRIYNAITNSNKYIFHAIYKDYTLQFFTKREKTYLIID